MKTTDTDTITQEMAVAAIEAVKNELSTEGMQSLDMFMQYALSQCTSQVMSRLEQMVKEAAESESESDESSDG